jgi:hypothetical protein
MSVFFDDWDGFSQGFLGNDVRISYVTVSTSWFFFGLVRA